MITWSYVSISHVRFYKSIHYFPKPLIIDSPLCNLALELFYPQTVFCFVKGGFHFTLTLFVYCYVLITKLLLQAI